MVGNNTKMKRMMEMLLELILETMNMATATSPEVELKMEDLNMSRDYLGPYGLKSEDKKRVNLLQDKAEAGEQTLTIDELHWRKIRK
jgi:hypothetical protein